MTNQDVSTQIAGIKRWCQFAFNTKESMVTHYTRVLANNTEEAAHLTGDLIDAIAKDRVATYITGFLNRGLEEPEDTHKYLIVDLLNNLTDSMHRRIDFGVQRSPMDTVLQAADVNAHMLAIRYIKARGTFTSAGTTTARIHIDKPNISEVDPTPAPWAEYYLLKNVVYHDDPKTGQQVKMDDSWTGLAVSDSNVRRYWYIGQHNGERSFRALEADNYDAAVAEAASILAV